VLPVDLAANAESLGVHVVRTTTRKELEAAILDAKASATSTVIHVETDPFVHAPDSESWWDVPVSQEAELASTREAYARYLEHAKHQQHFLDPTGGDS